MDWSFIGFSYLVEWFYTMFNTNWSDPTDLIMVISFIDPMIPFLKPFETRLEIQTAQTL